MTAFAPQHRVDRRVEVHCATCRYGAVVARLPERCPMCGSTAWRAPPSGRDRPTRERVH
jgi:primosomal protein N'